MCKTHSTNPYPGPSDLGDGRYHECIGQQNLATTPVCTCVFLPITITIDSVDTKWYKRPGKTFPSATMKSLLARTNGGYMEKIKLSNQDTYETCADYCTASDWTATEPCKSFGWNSATYVCELYSESEASTALEADAAWDFYEQVPDATNTWWEKPQRNPGYCSHTSMAATEATRDTCAGHTTAAACTGLCTWTAPLTWTVTQPEAPWAEAP